MFSSLLLQSHLQSEMDKRSLVCFVPTALSGAATTDFEKETNTHLCLLCVYISYIKVTFHGQCNMKKAAYTLLV